MMNSIFMLGFRPYSLRLVGTLALGIWATAASARDPDTPRELGRIAWRRGFDAAVEVAKRESKPLLVLFDEVPGCATCTGYGDLVLSHPLIVEAAETLFVPVAVYNNIAGADEQTLKSFREPAWNNPVVRIIQADRRDVVPRLDGDYTIGGLADRMIAALDKLHQPIPTYLRLLADEYRSRARKLERATFAMGCFWQGEVSLGELPGVIATAPGYLGGNEVVEVEFDPTIVSYAALVQKARQLQCATRIYCRSDEQQNAAARVAGADPPRRIRSSDDVRPDREPKYHLGRSPWKFVPMTSLQACRVNAAVGRGRDPKPLLSPRQLALFEQITAHPDAGWSNAIGAADLARAWQAAQTTARPPNAAP